MRRSKLYYNDIYLGTLYEDGKFKYKVNSKNATQMDMETVIHILERIRLIGLQDGFNYDNYIQSYQNSMFKDGFEFKQGYDMDENRIIDTPYNDRYCNNCNSCTKTDMRYCLKHHIFVAKNKWCPDWHMENRYYNFDNQLKFCYNYYRKLREV